MEPEPIKCQVCGLVHKPELIVEKEVSFTQLGSGDVLRSLRVKTMCTFCVRQDPDFALEEQ
jgi:hypothetical protein